MIASWSRCFSLLPLTSWQATTSQAYALTLLLLPTILLLVLPKQGKESKAERANKESREAEAEWAGIKSREAEAEGEVKERREAKAEQVGIKSREAEAEGEVKECREAEVEQAGIESREAEAEQAGIRVLLLGVVKYHLVCTKFFASVLLCFAFIQNFAGDSSAWNQNQWYSSVQDDPFKYTQACNSEVSMECNKRHPKFHW